MRLLIEGKRECGGERLIDVVDNTVIYALQLYSTLNKFIFSKYVNISEKNIYQGNLLDKSWIML